MVAETSAPVPAADAVEGNKVIRVSIEAITATITATVDAVSQDPLSVSAELDKLFS
jgi:hypothetical protein